MEGYIGAAQLTSGNSYRLQGLINANCPYLPFFLDIPSVNNQFNNSGGSNFIPIAAGNLCTTAGMYGLDSFLYNSTNSNAPYAQCLVTGSSIEVSFQPLSVYVSSMSQASGTSAFVSNSNDCVAFSIAPQLFNTSTIDVVTTTGAGAAAQTILTSERTKTLLLGTDTVSELPFARGPLVVTSDNQNRYSKLKSSMSMNKFFGITKNQLASDIKYRCVQANTTNVTVPIAAPDEQVMWTVSVSAPDNQSNINRIPYKIKLRQYVTFMEPIPQALDPINP